MLTYYTIINIIKVLNMENELIEQIDKFSPEEEIKKLKEMLENPEISQGQSNIISETIREWIAWQKFKVGDIVIFLLRKKASNPGSFSKAKVTSKSTTVPMVKVEVEGIPPFLISPSIIANIEDI